MSELTKEPNNLFEYQEMVKSETNPPKRIYDYINEQGEQCKHTPRQYRLRDFYMTHDTKHLTREEQLGAYEEWLIQQSLYVFDMYNYGYINTLTEENNISHNNKSCSREFRKDYYALKYSETMHKVFTKEGIATDINEAKEYANKMYITAKKEMKKASIVRNKVLNHFQGRLVFNKESGLLEAVKE